MFFSPASPHIYTFSSLHPNFFSENRLAGISDLKVKTAWASDESPANTDSKVIIFYCGPATDEARMLAVGQNLINEIPYTDKFGWIYYKSDLQTFKGTRATGRFLIPKIFEQKILGSKKNHSYRLAVPKRIDIYSKECKGVA